MWELSQFAKRGVVTEIFPLREVTELGKPNQLALGNSKWSPNRNCHGTETNRLVARCARKSLEFECNLSHLTDNWTLLHNGSIRRVRLGSPVDGSQCEGEVYNAETGAQDGTDRGLFADWSFGSGLGPPSTRFFSLFVSIPFLRNLWFLIVDARNVMALNLPEKRLIDNLLHSSIPSAKSWARTPPSQIMGFRLACGQAWAPREWSHYKFCWIRPLPERRSLLLCGNGPGLLLMKVLLQLTGFPSTLESQAPALSALMLVSTQPVFSLSPFPLFCSKRYSLGNHFQIHTSFLNLSLHSGLGQQIFYDEVDVSQGNQAVRWGELLYMMTDT